MGSLFELEVGTVLLGLGVGFAWEQSLLIMGGTSNRADQMLASSGDIYGQLLPQNAIIL